MDTSFTSIYLNCPDRGSNPQPSDQEIGRSTTALSREITATQLIRYGRKFSDMSFRWRHENHLPTCRTKTSFYCCKSPQEFGKLRMRPDYSGELCSAIACHVISRFALSEYHIVFPVDASANTSRHICSTHESKQISGYFIR